MWVRRAGAFPAIVDADLFARARALVEERSRRFSDEELIGLLRDLLAEQGALSGLVNAAARCASPTRTFAIPARARS